MNIVLEQAKKDMAEDGVCDVGALMDEVERLTDLLNKIAWHRGDEGLPDVPVLQPRYDALRQRVQELEGRPVPLSEWQKMEAELAECKREHEELFDGNHALMVDNRALRQRVIALEESEKRWIQQSSDFERLAVIAQQRADREAELNKSIGDNT